MEHEQQQPMSDARLEEIQKRWREREYGQMDISGQHRIASASGAWNYWIANAAVDEGELLAEVERLKSDLVAYANLAGRMEAQCDTLRAREAALLEVVRAVANGWNNALGMRIGETPMDGVELKRKARALLASGDEAK